MANQQLIAYPQSTVEPIVYPTGEVILDLYKDEPIPLVLNVDDFTNIAEADSSYSKSFDIPGTKNNNKFFNHIYNINSDSDFNPHLRTKIIVKEGTINTFEGYLQLNEIINKGGDIIYNITLFSEVVNLKDAIGNKVFRDLDLSELNHLYVEANIENSWTGVLNLFNPLPADSFAGTGSTTDVLKYPMVNWAGHITSSTSGSWYGYVYNYFRPFINALYLLRNIFRDAGYTFTSNFLESNTKFNKLYADFNIDGSSYSTDYYVYLQNQTGTYTTTGSILNSTTKSGGQAALYDLATDKCTATVDGTEVDCEFNLYFNNGGNDVEIRLYHTNTSYPGNYPSGTLLWSSTINPANTGFGSIIINAGESCWLEVKGIGGSVSISNNSANYVGWVLSQNTSQYINNILLGFKGDVGQWDFFKSIIDMFKLVVLVDEDNPTNLLIEPYKDWVDSGNLIDLTNKVDDTEIKYMPIDGLARYIDFNFTEDADDWITPNLNNPSTRIYGYNFISNIDIIDKDDEKIEIGAISDTYIANYDAPSSTYPMPQIIDSSVDAAGQPLRYWENNLRLLYDNGVQTLPAPVTYSTLQGNFVNESDYLLFTAVEDYPITSSSHSIRFNTVSEPYSSQIIINNLYNIYWSKYIDELYHKDTRIVKLEAYLTADDIYSLNFNDIILIKNKKFRIHKIDYSAGNMSKLELITIKDL